MKNIIINGERGVGKSTLIERLLADYPNAPLFGFFTKKESPDDSGDCMVYIHNAGADIRSYTESNRVGSCKNCHGKPNSKVFDVYGAKLLSNIPERSLVVMDELGFFESDAYIFQRKVFALLRSECVVIAAVKDKNTDFLNAVRTNFDSNTYDITIQNRDELYNVIKPVLAEYMEKK